MCSIEETGANAHVRCKYNPLQKCAANTEKHGGDSTLKSAELLLLRFVTATSVRIICVC